MDLRSPRSAGLIQPLESKIELEWDANPHSFSAKGYDVRSALTNDQTQYPFTILPKPEQWKSGTCLPVFVTNESGIIFHGSAIDGPATSGIQ
jgi:hypothetical protein